MSIIVQRMSRVRVRSSMARQNASRLTVDVAACSWRRAAVRVPEDTYIIQQRELNAARNRLQRGRDGDDLHGEWTNRSH